MDLKELELLAEAAERHWYYASKARAVLACLANHTPERILDVGAGSGFFSKVLLRETGARSAICVDRGYTSEWEESCAGKPVAFRRSISEVDADVVLMLDVLEHADNDRELLRQYVDKARRGTRFVISVPAFSWLWSKHDDFLEHRRRYTLRGLQAVVADVRLSPVRSHYFFAGVFPAVAVHRVLRRLWNRGASAASDLRQHHPVTNSLLARLCSAESGIARYNRAFGLTVFSVSEKA